jgi:hypothetical protein
MAKDKLTDYDSTTPSNNTDIGGISVAEGMLPSAVNNSIRELTKQLGAFADGTDGIDVLSLADDDASHAIKLQAPASVTATTTFTLPDGDGASGQAMITDGAGTLSWAAPYGNRNLIINGAMQVAQRGTSTSMAHDGTTNSYGIDRFKMSISGTHGELDGTYAQVSDHPLSANGTSLKWTTGTAETSYDANSYVYFTQKIEAQNLQHLNYGNSNAQSVTLSFYVKSSVTGTFAVGFYKEDTTTRIFNQTYTINSANTWEKKTITFAGDTDGGGIVNDNGAGLWTSWHLAAGSGAVGGGSVGAWKSYNDLTDWADGQATNAVMTTASATWQITNVQLEVGETATPFEHRSYGDELRRCQRYYYRISESVVGAGLMYGIGSYYATNDLRVLVNLPTQMRTTPTVESSSTTNDFRSLRAGGSDYFTSILSAGGTFVNQAHLYTSNVSGTAGYSGVIGTGGTGTSFMGFDAEL